MKIGIKHYEFCKDEELCNYINDVLLKKNKNITRIINIVIDFRIGYKISKIIFEEKENEKDDN